MAQCTLYAVSSGINRLPLELLAEIFVVYAAETMVPVTAFLMRPDALCHFRWTHIMLVCRKWRAICLATNALWRTIKAGCTRHGYYESEVSEEEHKEKLRWMELVLPRSAGAPLELTISDLAFATIFRPLLVQHAHRIRRLTIPDHPPFRADAVVSVLDIPMPSLVELDLLYGEQWEDLRAISDELEDSNDTTLISPQRYPLLRFLRLSSLFLEESFLRLLPQLNTLDIRGCMFRDLPLSFYSLLDALEDCPSLEELQLHGVLRHLTISDGPPARTSKPLSLKRLRKIVVHDEPKHTRRLLSHLPLPSHASLHVIGEVYDVDDLSDLPSVFSSLLPIDRSGIPLLQTASHVYIRNLQDIDITAHLGSVELGIKLDVPDDHDPEDLPGCLKTVTALFCKAPLVFLDVTGQFDTVKRTRTWIDVLSAFPKLRYLSFTGEGSLLNMVCALGHPPPSLDVDANHAGRGPSHTDGPVCPKLSCLEFTNIPCRLGLMESLLGVLSRRKSCSLPPLANLFLELCCDGADECECETNLDLYAEELSNFAVEARIRSA